MKKPLILLVDDDPAVLAALEAELVPGFSDLARIEAFEDPRAVLEALPGWAAEGRSVAVAIVDQKMPGMTGVELVAALGDNAEAAENAASAPVRHMRSVLLTGYAGLDSALAAKNDARVNRYIEKPWDGLAMKSTVAAQLAGWLSDSGSDEHYALRAASGLKELGEVFRLRFSIYASSEVTRRVLPDTPSRLDVDAYDSVSAQLALFVLVGGAERMIGTLRLAGAPDGGHGTEILHLVADDAMLLERASRAIEYPLPLMTYLVDRDAVLSLHQRLSSLGERFVEPSRFTLDPSWRSRSGAAERHLARHVIEGAVAYFLGHGLENALLTCASSHAAMYHLYGFRETEGTTTQMQPLLQTEVACLHGRPEWIPPAPSERCRSLSARLQRPQGACRCANFPACLGGPYETGDFSHVDLFCPALASERLVQLGS